jgi:hypothetical protein
MNIDMDPLNRDYGLYVVDQELRKGSSNSFVGLNIKKKPTLRLEYQNCLHLIWKSNNINSNYGIQLIIMY